MIYVPQKAKSATYPSKRVPENGKSGTFNQTYVPENGKLGTYMELRKRVLIFENDAYGRMERV